MPKCKNDILISKVGINKLTKNVEVDFDVFRSMDTCNRINAKNYYQATTTPTFDKWEIPENAFECESNECVNSGTLSGFGTNVTYKVVGDVAEWAAGIIAFYATATAPTVEISATDAFTDSATYDAHSNGSGAYTVDLSQTPKSSKGEGYTATGNVAYIRFAGMTKLSSIAIFNEALDFNTINTVKVGCLTGIDGTWDFDIAEETCFNPARYDSEALQTIERTVTGNSVTANYLLLNPAVTRGKVSEGFDMETLEVVAEADGSFAKATMPADYDAEQCGRVTVSVDGVCSPHDGLLTYIDKAIEAIEPDQFKIENGAVVVNSALAGKTLIISYPKKVAVESYDICADNLDGVRARMSYAKCHTDGVKYRYVYDNVLITSFPDGVTNDGEQEFSFTVTILKGKDGCFGHVYKILD